MLFKVSSVFSPRNDIAAIKVMHIGKMVVVLFLMTCSTKKGNVQTVPSNAVEEKEGNSNRKKHQQKCRPK